MRVSIQTSALHSGWPLCVPEQGGFALVGDADGGEIARGEIGARQRGTDHLIGVGEDFHRVVLDPARLGIDLPVFLLGDGDDVSAPVEDDEARAGRTLVYGANILVHFSLRFLVIVLASRKGCAQVHAISGVFR